MAGKGFVLSVDFGALTCVREESMKDGCFTSSRSRRELTQRHTTEHYAESEICNTQSQVRCLPQIPPPRAQGTTQKRRQKDCRKKGMDDLRKQRLSDITDELTQTVVAHTGPV